MDKDTIKQIRADINNSTIPDEIKLLYLMANATEIMSRQILMRLKVIYAKRGYNVHENDMLKGINGYCKFVKMASHQFFERIEPHIFGATWGVAKDEGEQLGVDVLDQFESDTNEVVRLVMLYIDRVSRNDGGFARVFKTLRQMPSLGIFKDEDIAKYKMREK